MTTVTTPHTAVRAQSQDYMAIMPDGTEVFYRTAREAPIAMLVGITYDGKQAVYRWTSQEYLVRMGMNALRRSHKWAVCVREITPVDKRPRGAVQAYGHEATYRRLRTN